VFPRSKSVQEVKIFIKKVKLSTYTVLIQEITKHGDIDEEWSVELSLKHGKIYWKLTNHKRNGKNHQNLD